MREPEHSRRLIIDQLAPRLEAEGYSVVYEPPRQLLPPFMGSYVPDAIALGQDKKIAIEVIVEGQSSEAKERDLRRLFRDARDWELNVYFVRPGEAEELSPVSLHAIEDAIESLESLAQAGALAAALIMGWGIFEALARYLAPDKYRKPQTPARLVESLANSGYVTPSEADFLREAGRLRNSLAHGDLERGVKEGDVRRLIAVLRELRTLAVDGVH
ncbi:hypothetical protein [Methylocystis sp. JR02]|uniref:hypothetical protein n=1 Tax=Methylocystis sp. JR02 TaxID=3046284 RepID=UPI0024BB048D|nr:hypothetical protein [Methylocystis sp. JR02]MDJ0448314.1 hypothetical protein [Methylocystis sp. JR02]